MDGRLLPVFLIALIGAPAVAAAPARLSPVLPEVTKHLQEGFADVVNNTPVMARAEAQLILLDNQVKYSVSFENVPEKQRAQCMTCLRSAMAEWEHDLDGTIQFSQVPSVSGKTTGTSAREPAEVTVRFRPSVTMKKEQVAGYVNWSRTLNASEDGTVSAKFSADLQIRVKDLDGRRMPPEAMRHAAMHELGHVLGLDDSPTEGDVMGPLDIENPVSAPTNLEIQTVKSLRSQANEILDKLVPNPKKQP
jgi:predicted Zn-dependent protease